jgi:hypothetical protein
VLLVETKIVLNDQKDHQCGADADRQPDDVDKRECLIPEKVPECGFEIILYHVASFILLISFLYMYYSVLKLSTGLAIAALIAW